ncbi:hypothetical protein sos41_37980 [Alphaproteobacteria bacterium SO-S41]|nr:hypothetical protein sos41_37980 [Alphaproteobacteria bacterium SO-S41]
MADEAKTISVPGVIARSADRMMDEAMRPAGGYKTDFTQPAGEAALAAADSVSWRVFKNPISLFVGGITAVLMEFAEPKVRDGVWQNSTFRTDPLGRLKRTGLAAMVTVYGPHSQAEKMIAGVTRMHGRVRGVTSEGEAYEAMDPVLLDWVQATASYGFMEAYHRFAKPLSAAERDRFYAEAKPAAALYGAVGAPASVVEFEALMMRMTRRFVPSPIATEFLDIMMKVPALPGIARPLQRMLVRAAVDILPDQVETALALCPRWRLGGVQRRIVGLAARTANRIVLRTSPAVQSCRRMGLPDDYLYRG